MPAGTLRSVLPFGSCSINFVFSREALETRLSELWSWGMYLRAVYVPASPYSTEGAWVVIFGQTNDSGVTRFHLDEKGRLAKVASCGGDPLFLLNPDGRELLPPPR